MNTVRVFGILLVIGALSAALIFSQIRSEPFHVSGFIESDEIRVGSRVGGRVAKVEVTEGQAVSKGDSLIELEPFDLLERRAEATGLRQQRVAAHDKLRAGFRTEEIAMAKANVDQMQAQLNKLNAGPRPQEISVAEARLELANAELQRATTQYRRFEALLGKGAANREQFDETEKQLKVTQAKMQVATEELGVLTEGSRKEDIAAAKAALDEAVQAWKLQSTGYRSEEVTEAEAAVESAQARLDAIDRQLAELTIIAPVDGVVEAVDLQPGDLVGPNAPAVSLVDTNCLWVRAYVPENRLDLQLNQQVRITVDSYPNHDFSGRITFVARRAEFTPGNVQTPEERSKQVFRIKVTLTSGLDVLRPGMAADVWLDEQRGAQ
jgi:HlyD family secretion protein